MLEPLASALSVLTEDEKELGVCLVEMGAGTTDVAVFHEGKIRHLGTVNYGGNNVTSDIVHGLGVTQADAERLKEAYGCAYEPMVDHSEIIKLPSTVAQGDRQIPRELLAHIIHQRTDEIFELVMRDVDQAGFLKRLAAGVVVTGGAAAQPGTGELASEVFGTGRPGWRAGRVPRRSGRLGAGAALLDGGRPRAVRRAPPGARRGRREGEAPLDGRRRRRRWTSWRSGSRPGCRTSSRPDANRGWAMLETVSPMGSLFVSRARCCG